MNRFDHYSKDSELGDTEDIAVHTPIIHLWVQDIQKQLLELKQRQRQTLSPIQGKTNKLPDLLTA